MKIAVVMNVDREHKLLLQQAAPDAEFMYFNRDELTKQDLKTVEVILGNFNPELLEEASCLKWIQLSNAGTEGFWKSDYMKNSVILTNASGAYGEVMAEHVLSVILSLAKHLPEYALQQSHHVWKEVCQPVLLKKSTVLILGFGDIGRNVGRLLHCFGCYIVGCKKHIEKKEPYADELCTFAELDIKIPQADIIVLSLPANKETYQVLDKHRFALMKETCILVNVGRGASIDTQALSDALKMKKIAGAALDVTDPEPLPQDHYLWTMKNCIITPHISGKTELPYAFDRIIAICIENLGRYLKKQSLCNVVDMQTGYRKAGTEYELL